MNDQKIEPNSSKDSVGGCSYLFTILFLLTGLAWPMLHSLSGSYEPDILLITVLFGIPSFIAAHILGAISIFSGSPGKSVGSKSLKLLWRAFGAFMVIIITGTLLQTLYRFFFP